MDDDDDDGGGSDLEDDICLSLCLCTRCYEDGQYEEAIFAGQTCLQMATEKGNEDTVMTACLVIGESEFELKEYEDAVSHCMTSMEVARKNDDFEVVMKTCLTLGKAHCALGYYDEALKYSTRCIEIAKEIASGLLYEGKACLVLSEVYCALGEYEGVISFGMRALNIGKEIGDIYTEMKSYLIIAEAYKALKYYNEAIEYAWGCIDVANDKQVTMKACLYLTELYNSLGDNDRENTIQCSLMLYNVAKEIGDEKNAMEACYVIMKTYKSLKQYKEAVYYAEICLGSAKEMGNKRAELETLGFIADTQFAADNYTETVRYARLCLEVAKETKDKREEMDACCFIANTQFEAGNFTEAVRYAKLTLELARETGDQGSEMKACKLIVITQCEAGNFTEAVRYAQLCLELAMEAGDQGSEMKACKLISNTQCEAGNRLEAIYYAEMWLEFAKATRDKHEEMDACYFIAITQREAGNFTEAVKYGLMCVPLATEIGDKHSEIDACFLIGNAGRALASPDEILQYATKRMTMEQESDGGGNKKIGCLLLGLVHCNMKKYDDALSHFEKAIDHAREERDEYGEMMIYHCLEVTHCHLQQIHNAISCCEKSIQIAKNIGANEWEMKRSLRLAQFYKMVNRNDQVELHASIALEIAKKLGDKKIQGDANIFLGDLYSKSGQDSKASACFNESVNIAKQTGNTFTEIFATLLAPFWSLSEAKKRMEKVQDMFKGFSLPLHTITETDFEGFFSFVCSIHNYLLLLIKFCAGDDSTEEFINLFEKGLQQLKPKNTLEFSVQPLIHSLEKSTNVLPLKTEEKTAVRKAFHLLAEHERSANKFPNSLEEFLISLRNVFKIVLELCKVCEDVFCFQAACHSIVGMAHYLLNDVPNAKASFIETTKCFESLFNGVGVDKSKISIVDRYADIYKLLSLILIQDGKTEEALAMAENCRAKALKDILVLMYGLDKEFFQDDYIQFDDILPVLKAEKSSILFYTVSFHGIHTFGMEDGKDLQFSVQPLIHPDLRFKNLIKEVYEELQVSDGFNYSSPLWVSRTTQILERDDECKEVFTKMIKERVIEKIAPEYGLNVGDLEECDWEELDDLTKKAVLDIDFEDPGYNRLEENNTPSPFDAIEGESSFTSALDALSHRLLDNVCLEQDEVVIIPDGLISIVPFAALTNPATGNYLSEDKKIRFVPSLTTLKMLSESREDFHTLKDAIFIGDPDYSRVLCDGKCLSQLPFAKKEVKAITFVYFNDVTPLTGAQATKRVVLEKLRKGASVIHIAAHGDLDKAAILLAPDPDVQEVPDEKDYMLTMADVQQAQVHAQLVVLSCCYSGRGEIKTEGVVGLCRAFLASGARAVVASLWAIDDAASHEFMVEFYGYLQDGNSASTSLQMAMKEIREIEEYSEPRFWAPFFLMGDDVTIKF